MTGRKIILDRNRTNILLDAVGSTNKQDVFHRNLNDTLLSLVLFDGAEVSPDNLEHRFASLQRLESEGLATAVPPHLYDHPCRLVDDLLNNMKGSDPESEYRFTALAQQKSLQAIWPLISETDPILSELPWFEARRMIEEWGIDFSDQGFYDTTFGEFQDIGSGQLFGLPNEVNYRIPDHFLEDFDYDRVEVDKLNQFVPRILSRYVEMRGLTERSEGTGYPVAADLPSGTFELDTSLGAAALQLCRIHLDEIRYMPYLENLDDVLRLRGHRYISNFRESIFEWLDRISSGETKIEVKYRNSIRVANQELQKLERWKLLDSPYVLAASIAVGVAEIFTGTLFGFGFAAASAAAMAQKSKLSKKYGYALFRP